MFWRRTLLPHVLIKASCSEPCLQPLTKAFVKTCPEVLTKEQRFCMFWLKRHVLNCVFNFWLHLHWVCCTPKFALPYSSRIVKVKVTKFPKGCAAQLSPRQSKLGFEFWSRKWIFQRPNQVSYACKDGQASSCQVSRLTRSSCTVKKP